MKSLIWLCQGESERVTLPSPVVYVYDNAFIAAFYYLTFGLISIFQSTFFKEIGVGVESINLTAQLLICVLFMFDLFNFQM